MSEKSAPAGRCPGEKVCPGCGASFVCGMEAGHAQCWCADLPPQPVDPAVSGCLCPACLQARAQTAPVYSPRAG
ncbi:MAG: cysteine-rich CWC family protein [Gammaproteobacteria bacterium]|jgi:hypothetical protein|nr:cysteine-rich CWC family protein [Gammaproteobacteria bacterium]